MIVITLAVIPLRSGPPSTMHSQVPANHAVHRQFYRRFRREDSGWRATSAAMQVMLLSAAPSVARAIRPAPAWARCTQAVALVAALADPDQGWDAIVIGELYRLL